MESQENELLKTQILEGRFLPVTEKLFSIYDQYESSINPQSPDDLAFLLCYKGETYFRIGNFEEALSRLTRCTRAPKSASLGHLDAIAYNLLGLIYSFLGYEVIAFENFKQCEKACSIHQLTGELIACKLNIGSLYRDMCDYEHALSYYNAAYELIPKDSKNYENIKVLTLSELGQTYCMKGNFSSADTIYQQLSSSSSQKTFYQIAVYSFYLRYFHHKNNLSQYQSALKAILDQAALEDDFFEFFEFYYDTCQFLLSQEEPVALRKLLDSLEKVSQNPYFSFLHYRIEELEVKYAKKYDSFDNYLEICSHFIEMQKSYHNNQISVILHSMEHVELLHKIKQDSAFLEEKSRLDQMTGLLNKYTIEFLIQEKLKENPEQPIALLLVDMDYFKQINGKLGHLTGDSIIRDTASIIKHFFPENALCGRVGGDEFLICISDFPDTTSVLLQAELLRQEICRQTAKRHLPLPTDASIGIAFSSTNRSNYATLFHEADNALYRAKKSGRNKVVTSE